MSRLILKYHAEILRVCSIIVIPLMFATLFVGQRSSLWLLWSLIAFQLSVFALAIYTVAAYRKFVGTREKEWAAREKQARESWPQAYDYLDALGCDDSELDVIASKEQRETNQILADEDPDNDFMKKTTGYEDIFWRLGPETQADVLKTYVQQLLESISKSPTYSEALSQLTALRGDFGDLIDSDPLLTELVQHALELATEREHP